MTTAGNIDSGGADLVQFSRHNHVAVFTLNRPRAMNAVSGAMSAQFERHLDAFEADEDLWVGVICSSHPKVFCAGADLKAVSSGTPISTFKGGFAGIVKYPRRKPMIAAVDGAALAGGCEIVLACDLCVAGDRARFGVPEVKRSLVAAAGGLFRLPQKLPKAIAMEMILTGDPINAQRAYEVGLINKVVPHGQALEAAMRLAERLTVNAPLAVQESKAAVDSMMQASLSDSDGFERSAFAFKYLAKTADYKEGPRAFIEKRPPKWTGKTGKNADAWLAQKMAEKRLSKL
jgi:enoyl-CoA hydratase